MNRNRRWRPRNGGDWIFRSSMCTRYVPTVPISRLASRRLEPIRRPPELGQWSGHWVAVKRGQVIAAAPTSTALAGRLREIGPSGEGTVTEYVRPSHEDAYVVGVG